MSIELMIYLYIYHYHCHSQVSRKSLNQHILTPLLVNPILTPSNCIRYLRMSSFGHKTEGKEVVSTFSEQLKGKTILISGPSEGTIGGQTALDLAAGKPEHLILAGRDRSKIQPVIDVIANIDSAVKVSFIALDLGNLASVREAAREISSLVQKIDFLINNAGIMALQEFSTTPDGIEMQFGVNHIGHFLLTNLLMDKILVSGKGGRIVNVSSLGHIMSGVRFDDWNFKNGTEYHPWAGYAQSKTANILFASALARKLEDRGVQAFSVEPGLVLDTKLQANVSQELFGEGMAIAQKVVEERGPVIPIMEPKSRAAGSATSLVAALDPDIEGKYFINFNHSCLFTDMINQQDYPDLY
ncbi:hypothetical protein ACMFMG_006835 [Clarireedia jacksonii]